MREVSIIGVDLAKIVLHLHGAAADGTVVFRRRMTRHKFRRFMAVQPACVVAMEACASAHYWARELAKLDHQLKLIAPCYVKPFVKREKNDTADAEAIVEAAQRPNTRFVVPKTADQQARAILFRTREQLINQRTELVNALRAHMYEFGYVAPKGISRVRHLEELVEKKATDLPDLVRDMCTELLGQITQLTARIETIRKRIHADSKQHEPSRRLQTMPGIGPICALAVEVIAPPMESFKCGRDFAAWLGLVPRQNTTGGKQRLGKTSRMGQRDIRRLLIIGAMAVVRWAARKGAPQSSWLARMMARKPRMVVAIALANKLARALWAMLIKEEDYRNPAIGAA